MANENEVIVIGSDIEGEEEDEVIVEVRIIWDSYIHVTL